MKHRAVFLDLDHTLIRPKSFSFATSHAPRNSSEEEQKAMFERLEAQIPKDAQPEFFWRYNNTEAGYRWRNTFPQDATDWEFMTDIRSSLRPFVDAGFMLVIVSNQGGIEAGYHTESEVENKIRNVVWKLDAAFCLLANVAYYFCPSMDKNHPDRKPNAGMIIKAQLEHEIDLSASFMVGDMESDRACAAAVGLTYIDVNEFVNPGWSEIKRRVWERIRRQL